MNHASSVLMPRLALLAFVVSTSGCCLVAPRGPALPGGLVAGLAQLQDYEIRREESGDRASNRDWRVIEPGQTLVIADLEGPGEVFHIWCTINSPDPHHQRNLVLRVYYDGNHFPSVESPIGDFFGLGDCKEYYFSNPVQAIGTIRGLNAFWPMPFRKTMRIEIENESAIRCESFYYYVNWRKFKKFPRNSAYFHAQYRQAYPCESHKPYLFLETEGARGHFVGANLSVHTQADGWWGEGDDIFTIDGEARPSLWGTGSEDYFGGAWCYGETFYTPYFGMPYRERLDQNADNYWNVYRLHLEAPIPFKRSLRFEMEHGVDGYDNIRAGGRNNNHASVAYWYMEKPVRLIGTLPPAAERLSTFEPIEVPEHIVELHKVRHHAVPRHRLGFGPQDTTAWTPSDRMLWFNHNHLFCGRNVEGSVVSFYFTPKRPLRGPAVLHLTQAPDYAKLRIRLNGKVLVDSFDAYAPSVRPATVELGSMFLDTIEHELEIETLGRNEASEGILWGVDYLRVGEPALDFEVLR